MIGKKEKSKFFLENSFNYICPLCNSDINVNDDAMVCSNNHSFNISKKGVVCLLNTGKFKTNYTYDKNLFTHRRNFLLNKYYSDVYTSISSIINETKNTKVNMIDLGCGEGLNDKYILSNLKIDYCFLGIDYNKDAINLAMDYENANVGFIISDVNNLPVSSDSIDIVINILSPYYSEEVKRILKKDGLFIKVIPEKKYLIELRNILGFDEYEKSDLLKTKLLNNFKLVDEIVIDKTYKINEEQLKDLQAMTPLVKSKKLKDRKKENVNINSITINLKILVMRRK